MYVFNRNKKDPFENWLILNFPMSVSRPETDIMWERILASIGIPQIAGWLRAGMGGNYAFIFKEQNQAWSDHCQAQFHILSFKR